MNQTEQHHLIFTSRFQMQIQQSVNQHSQLFRCTYVYKYICTHMYWCICFVLSIFFDLLFKIHSMMVTELMMMKDSKNGLILIQNCFQHIILSQWSSMLKCRLSPTITDCSFMLSYIWSLFLSILCMASLHLFCLLTSAKSLVQIYDGNIINVW